MYPKLTNRSWRVLKSENILRLGPWLSVRQECVELPSGTQIPSWYILEFPNWINVIAITKDGKMVMEDQYRHALGETHYELVAGVIDPGETPLQAAQRELSEETGYEGGEWSLFMTLSPNPTNHNNLSYTFLATGVEKCREQHLEATEDIHVDVMEPQQVLEMLRDGEIIQALHAAPLWRYFAEHPIEEKRLSAEEKANTWTHLIPFIATMVAAVPLIRLAMHTDSPTLNVIGTVLFVIGALLMFGSSTLYHAVANPVHKARLRIFDHIAIYTMIAGSYSLICLSVVGGWAGWTLFGFLWACVVAGIIGKLIALGKHPRLSLALYLAMGWVALLIIWPMWQHMPHAAFWWIIAEGVFYTIGSYFFNKDEEHAFYHAVWHVFITLGAISHFIATWLILA